MYITHKFSQIVGKCICDTLTSGVSAWLVVSYHGVGSNKIIFKIIY